MSYEPEPVLSSGGVFDELSAAGRAAAYAAGRANSYAAAHAIEDAEELRNELAARDFTPEEFAAVMDAECPGILYSMTGTAYVANRYGKPPEIALKYEGWAKFEGAPIRHVKGESFRELAEQLAAEFRMRKGLRVVPVVEAAV